MTIARVIANFGAAVAVQCEGWNEPRSAQPLSRLPLLVAGDEVQLDCQDPLSMRVTDLTARRSVLERADRRGQAKPLAANLTHLGIVSACKPGFDRLLIDQLCIAAIQTGVAPIIIVNKADLLDPGERTDMQRWLTVYQDIGHSTAVIDTRSDAGMAPLHKQLAGRVLVLTGASGVGKSSIIDRLLPDRDVRVGALSSATGFGAHTTSVTCWYPLAADAAIIDSPGVRQYSVAHLAPAAVRRGYVEIDALGTECRFGDCAHVREPGCAVRDALASGALARWRYANYCKLSDL